MVFIGIDVSKDKLDVCCIFEERHRFKQVANTLSGFRDLQSWIDKNGFSGAHICMESTECYSEGVAEFLYNAGFKVSIANPMSIKSFKKSVMVRQKTDKVDAYMIAKFCEKNDPKTWKPKTAEAKILHDIISRISSLKEKLIASSNVLENKGLSKIVIKNINKETKFLEKSIEKLEGEAMKIIAENADLKLKFERLTAILGVGPKLVLTILAEMPDIENFQNAGQYASFVGVTPSHKESGTSVHGKSHISKIGNTITRKTLYMSALSVKNHNPYFQNFVQKLVHKHKPPKVIICAVMRKLMYIFFEILKNPADFDPKLAFPA